MSVFDMSGRPQAAAPTQYHVAPLGTSSDCCLLPQWEMLPAANTHRVMWKSRILDDVACPCCLPSLCKQLFSTSPPPFAGLKGHKPNPLATGTASFP